MESKTKKIICIISFSLLIILFILLLIFTIDSKQIVEVTQFIKTDTKVLYITSDDKLTYPIEILEKYDIEYMHVDSSNLSIFELKKLEELIDNDNLNNTIVVYTGGEIVDTLVNYKSKKNVDEFLQKNSIIPEKISDSVEEIMYNVNTILENTYSMVYIPYKEKYEIDSQNKIIKNIADKYEINYQKIDAYLLSATQQEKINNLLGLSVVEDQILILVKDNKMIANIRGIHSKNTYIETLYEANFINELETKVNELNYGSFIEELNSQEKSIILIGSDSLKDSNEVFNLLNEMIYNYDIKVNYINVEENEEYNKVKGNLENIGYDGGFSLPLVVIVESNNILDYVIGNSKEEYFIDIFIENGVIKGDVINE